MKQIITYAKIVISIIIAASYIGSNHNASAAQITKNETTLTVDNKTIAAHISCMPNPNLYPIKCATAYAMCQYGTTNMRTLIGTLIFQMDSLQHALAKIKEKLSTEQQEYVKRFTTAQAQIKALNEQLNNCRL